MKFFYFITALAGILCMCGCGTYSGGRDERVRRDMDVQTLKLEISGMKESVTDLSGTDEDMYARIEKMESKLAEGMRAMDARIAVLEKTLAEIREDRARLRQEIVDQLTPKIAEILKGVRPVNPSGSGTGEYYEHVVQAGETLSAIAGAYGVSINVIITANKLKDANAIKVGQKLLVPKK